MELKGRLYILAQDTASMSDLHEYMIETLKKQIIENAFNDKDVKGYAQAKIIIDSMFNELKTQGTIVPNFINENV